MGILPEISKEKAAKYDYFPTTWQAVIWRNWGYIPVERIASAIGTDCETVRSSAKLMGLNPDETVNSEWERRGYLTIIRNNWNLCTYEQIMQLLDISEKQLAFILKEDDFLAYSRNFKLIENYVKSLIGTKVVLFIGYSFNDPDLKLIFSWVKDILGGDFQRAYLIEAGKAYDVNEAEYFRNFGINLLYASIQLQDRFKSNDLTNNLLLMLDWLLSVEKKD